LKISVGLLLKSPERFSVPVAFSIDNGPEAMNTKNSDYPVTKSTNSDGEQTITLLLPTLNEIDGMRLIIPQLQVDLFDEIIVLDGGSADGTIEYAKSQGLRVIRQKRKGLAAGIYDAVYEMQTDYVIEFSPDGNCLVEHLPELVSKLKAGFDLVVVSRYLPPAFSEDDTLITGIGNFLFTRMFRLLGQSKCTDVLGIFRGYRCRILRSKDFKHFLLGPVLEPLTSGYCAIKKLRICEIPGIEKARVGGETKNFIPYNGTCILLMFLRLMLFKLTGWKL
tara:strand:- start:3499 stop:4332 length:834 start_codon:yes stop_codon:yes gene_type:complete